MIKLKDILNEMDSVHQPDDKSRRRIIDRDKVVKLLKEKFTESLSALKNGNQNGRFLKRRLRKGGDPYYFINPKIRERTSSGKNSNFYNVLVSMVPSWRGYPKRTRSIICLSNRTPPSDYGHESYYVFPINGSKIVQTSTDDFWYGAPYLRMRTGVNIDSFDRFSRVIENLFILFPNIPDKDKLNVNDTTHITEGTYKDVIFKLNKYLTKELVDSVINEGKLHSASELIKHDILKNFNGDWEAYFDSLLNPKENDIDLVTIETLKEGECECWLDSPSIMIREYEMSELLLYLNNQQKRSNRI
jgi:hypothetical protein